MTWANVMVVIVKSKKRKVSKNLSVCAHPGFDDTVPWSRTQVSFPIMGDDSLGYHGIMKILCNVHFIGYEVIKQKVSQLLLPWEALMMLCSKGHGCCPNGESVSLPLWAEKNSSHPRAFRTSSTLKEITSLEQKTLFSYTQARKEMLDTNCSI